MLYNAKSFLFIFIKYMIFEHIFVNLSFFVTHVNCFAYFSYKYLYLQLIICLHTDMSLQVLLCNTNNLIKQSFAFA